MKKNKGFTLIELLAIIVILAIIAVITVPIILNIIETSQKGAVTDSAYGYKDAINKFYVSKLAQDKDYILPNKTYSTEELKIEGVNVSGQEPIGDSWVTIENNKVTEGCLQFDEYKVDITSGQLGEAIKGECENPNPPIIPSCPGCVFAYTTQEWYFWGTNRTRLTDSTKYSKNYNTIISKTGRKYFLGLIIDSNSQEIARAFACGIHDNGTPFCIEGTGDGSANTRNRSLMNSSALWNSTCAVEGASPSMTCKGTISAGSSRYGGVTVKGPNGYCTVSGDTYYAKCYES